MSSTPASPVKRPPRRRWHRLLRWLVVLMTVLVVALGCGLWWAWKNQTAVVRLALARLPMPVRVELGSLDADWERVVISGLKILDKTSAQLLADVPLVTWRPEWDKVRQGELGELEVQGAGVRLSGQTLAAFASADQRGSASDSMPLRFSRLKVTGARFEMEGTAVFPKVSLEVDCEGTDLRVGEHPLPHLGDFELALKNVVVDDQALTLPGVKLGGSLDAASGSLYFASVEMAPVELKLPPEFIERVARTTKSSSTKSDSEFPLKSIQIDRMALPSVKLDTTELERWPKVTGELAFQSESIRWKDGGGVSFGSQTLALSEVVIRPPEGGGVIRVPKLAATVRSHDASERIEVESVQVDRPVVEWAQGLENWLIAGDGGGAGGGSSTDMPAIALGKLELNQASLSLSRTTSVAFEGRTELTLKAGALRLDGQGLRSAGEQSLVISDLTLAEHPPSRERALDAFLKLKRGELVLVPDDWSRNKQVRKLAFDSAKVSMLPENSTFLQPRASGGGATAPGGSQEPWWQKVRFEQLMLTGGDVNVSYTAAQRVDISAAVEVKTEPYKSMDGNVYHTVSLKHLRILAPELAETPVTNVEEVTATVEWPSLWTTQRVESLRVRGGEMDVNEVMKKITGASPSTNEADARPSVPAPPMDSAAQKRGGWHINRLAIADTYITLHRLAPGLPPLKFALNYDVWDMPLEPKELMGRLEPQKIELSHLSLRSPFDPLREVAIMNSIFIHFTLDGLLAGRIDRVEVLSPTLNVGEDLFWYVDYYRKYAAGELPEDEPAPRIVSTDPKFAFDAAGDIQVAPPGSGGWTVEELAVTGGKLVVAPKGIPLPGIPRPFPFSFVTRLENGQFEAELEIPSDTYTWENLKLEFENLRGHVLFNLPHKQVSNNLTETFRVDVIRYKQLHIEDCFLTVTYDAAGIYGQFGGKAYEGYVNGGFNIYNDTSFTWDGWIAGTGVRTTEITQKLTPTYLLLDGKVDATVIAQGNMSEVFQTDIKFMNTEPGKFSITTLNSALDSIPRDIPGYLQDITRIGIETVRDFDYDKAEAEARFYGREGRGHLRLSGPYGTRNIEVNVFDHRWKVNKKPSANSSETLHAIE